MQGPQSQEGETGGKSESRQQIGQERRQADQLCQFDSVVVTHPGLIHDVFRGRRQSALHQPKPSVFHEKESLTVSALKNVKNLEMSSS